MAIDEREYIDAQKLQELFSSVNWSTFTAQELRESFSNSWNWLSCRDSSGKLIGFIRILSDGMRHAYLCSLVVHAAFQKQNIGHDTSHQSSGDLS